MKKFTFYLEGEALKVKAGDKLPLTLTGKAPDILMYGVKNETCVDLILCSNDPHDQNYLKAEKLEAMPEDVTATVVAVESDFGINTVVITIDELEAV